MSQERWKNQIEPFAGGLDDSTEEGSFRSFQASELYCPKCRQAMPVKERTLLHLPRGTLEDYVCSSCGTSLGTRKS